ncbi:hypothetical protein MML48_2g00009272 [Holotrichia oblita]|uniref:Uncharacterized protein n=1 Tax=Holotrichia oblita TaxID=644536 RepID=A0ACB9TLZ4_HOLOL|nr:hypothetical protein MML48_2g00009272 [Holotrichia oblita]
MKVNEAKVSGAEADEQYEPHLWYFDLLLFTSDQELPRGRKDNLGDDSEKEMETDNDVEKENTDTLNKIHYIFAYY